MNLEKIILNEKRNVTLTAYLQDVGGEYRFVTERPAVIVLPGGGYMFCSDREADPVAMPFLKAGYHVFILRYSVGEHSIWPQPLNDYDEAVEYILDHAKEWHVMKDKIAVAGFSAGGHLAGAAATLAKHRPTTAILGYAVLNEDTVREIDQSFSQAVQCNVTMKPEQYAPDITKCVDATTSPCFLFAARTDNVVPVQNTLDMMEALTKYEITYECHIYPYGPHGFSTGDYSVQDKGTNMPERARNWVKDALDWLQDIFGDFTEGGMTNPKCKAHISGDANAWLSLDCTISRLWGNPKAMEILDETVQEMREKIEPFAPDLTFDDMMGMLGKMTLKDLLIERNVAVDRFDELDEKLGKVPNI